MQENVLFTVSCIITCLVFVLVGFGSYMMLFEFAVHCSPALWGQILNQVLFGIVTLIGLLSFVLTICVDPGGIPQKFLDSQPINDDVYDQRTLSPMSYYDPNRVRYCKHCSVRKPPRSNHCKISNRCVLRMDHFCFFVANTIGYFNHKFFLLFLFYAIVGVVHILILGVLGFIIHGWDYVDQVSPIGAIGTTIFLVIVAQFGIGLAGYYFTWEIRMLLRNETMVEEKVNSLIRKDIKYAAATAPDTTPFRHVYDLGYLRNVQSVLGNNYLLWFLPVPAQRPLSLRPGLAKLFSACSNTRQTHRDEIDRPPGTWFPRIDTTASTQTV